jgi:hypothetical protein
LVSSTAFCEKEGATGIGNVSTYEYPIVAFSRQVQAVFRKRDSALKLSKRYTTASLVIGFSEFHAVENSISPENDSPG